MVDRKLIDADLTRRLLDFLRFNVRRNSCSNILKAAIGIIECQPAVDAVEVVRCKDCKWYSPENIDELPECKHPSGSVGNCGDLFFCADGERKLDV